MMKFINKDQWLFIQIFKVALRIGAVELLATASHKWGMELFDCEDWMAVVEIIDLNI